MAERTRPRPEDGDATVLEPERTTRLERPRMYRVLIHNDDYTTHEFVVAILKTVFHKSDTDAWTLTLQVHNHGVGVAGVYTREVAETKIATVHRLAREQEFPLLLTMEPDDRS
ncbi:MAG: ATP-dependent Clp protease adaptor ClpS [Myxococcota bacterium]|nr:ATP-dependent Clp protease adaptor ClpS [Myxococcota bacterium]MDW8361171.1 ATP-dependent Clp protease adaptor ClpS [Myxococcales bacterium]